MRTRLFLLALFATLFFAVAAAAGAQVPCNATAQVSHGTSVVFVSGHLPGAATVHGNISIAPAGPENISVRVTANISTGWHLSVNPDTIFFEGAQVEAQVSDFEIIVVVPPGQPANRSGSVWVRLSVTEGDQDCQPIILQGPTLVPSAYMENVALVALDPYSESTRTPGGLQIGLGLAAQANVPLLWNLTYESQEGLPIDGPSTIQVGPDASGWANATFEIHAVTSQAPSGVHVVRVLATAALDGDRSSTANASFFIRVNDFEPGLVALLTQGAIISVGALGLAAAVLFFSRRR